MTRRSRIGVALASLLATVVVGREASAQSSLSQYTTCVGTNPPANQVWIYHDINYGPPCAALTAGFYPYSGVGQNGLGGFGIANDAISSYKVGSGVRARFFQDGTYGGAFLIETGNGASMPSGWNDAISSIRVELSSRSQYCDDLNSYPGYFALYRGFTYADDCVVLPYPTTATPFIYTDPPHMGIANDSIRSANGGPTTPVDPSICPLGGIWEVALYPNSGNLGDPTWITQGQMRSDLGTFDAVTSSLKAYAGCYTL